MIKRQTKEPQDRQELYTWIRKFQIQDWVREASEAEIGSCEGERILKVIIKQVRRVAPEQLVANSEIVRSPKQAARATPIKILANGEWEDWPASKVVRYILDAGWDRTDPAGKMRMELEDIEHWIGRFKSDLRVFSLNALAKYYEMDSKYGTLKMFVDAFNRWARYQQAGVVRA